MASGGNSQHKMSEETFDFVCITCAEDNTTVEAVKYCVECSGYFCQPCTDAHKKFPLMKSHNVMDVTESIQASGLQDSSLAFPTERCNIHKGKVLDMYCGVHDVVGCYVCIAKDHKFCEDIHIHSDTLYKLSDCKQTRSLLKDKMVFMETISEYKDASLQALVKAKRVALDEVNTCEKALEALIRKAAENSRNQVEATYMEIETELLNEKKTVDNVRDTLQATDDKLEKSEGNRAQQFVCAKIAKEKLKEADSEKIKQALSVKADVSFSFTPNQSLVNDIKALQGIGHVKQHKKQKRDLYSLKGSSDINLKLPDDLKECSAAGCCLTDDGQLLVTDYANEKLKRFDLQTLSVVDSCALFSQPLGVCCINNDEVAVACTKKQIVFVSIRNKMTPTGRMVLSHFCYEIGYNDDKLYVSDNGVVLNVYNLTGTLLQTVLLDCAGNTLFNCIRHVTFNENGKQKFVADTDKGVECSDVMGNQLITIEDTNINNIQDVCVDGRGNMLMVGFLSNTVVQFSENGEKLGVVVNKGDGLKGPQSVCFHQESNRMFVTMQDNNVLKMFQLE